MKRIILLNAALLFVYLLHSQDKIYRNNGKVIEAKVLEIGSAEIKYKDFKNPDGPIYILETDRIKKIVFANGTTQKFQDNFKDPERYVGQLNKALKLNFFSPLYGYTEFGFEKSTGVGKGYELSIGFIGLGKSETILYDYYSTNPLHTVRRRQGGAFISGGYKFGKLPDFILFGKTRITHLMQGTYAKPILYLGYYSENRIIDKGNGTQEVGKQHIGFGALQIEIGHQWVFGDKFLLDLYEGLGYGVDNKKDSYSDVYYDPYNDETAFNYANARLGKSPGLSYTFGIKFGLLIK